MVSVLASSLRRTCSQTIFPSSTVSGRFLSTRMCSSSGRVEPPNVKEIAKMAHIAVTDEEVRDWAPKIEGIVNWFGQLQQVDVEGVEPALRAAGQDSEDHALRPDTAVAYPAKDLIMSSAPAMEGSLLKIPKILASEQV